MTDINHVSAYFDGEGEKEWLRLEKSLNQRIEYAIHRRILLRNVKEGDHVLDLGSGPGRYAVDMLRKGARVTLGDISQVQIDLAKQKITDTGLNAEGYHRLDISDLSQFESQMFDVVVCIGGALSYVQDGYLDALREMVRVLRKGGSLVISGVSIYGILRVFPAGDNRDELATFGDHIDPAKLANHRGYLLTEPRSVAIHMPMMLYTTKHLSDVLTGLGCEITGTATANPLSTHGMKLERISQDEKASAALMDLELSLCERPEYLDMGEWVILAARKVND